MKGNNGLKRSLGLFELTLYSIGIILGAGIYAIIGQGAGLAGNALWLSFLIGAVIASLTGLSYAELGTMYPREAAEYTYMKKAFDKKYPAFIIGWLMIAVGIISAATVALGFGGYLEALTGVPLVMGAALIVLACTFMNFWGIKESAISNVVFTLIEAIGLVIIIFLASGHLGSVDYMAMPNGINGVMSAAVLVFFAFIGFESIVNLSEETKNPKKLIPKALIISIFATAILYVLVSMCAVSLVPWNVLAASNAPLADVAEAAMPGTSSLLGIIALFATANTVLIISIIASRVACGMARQGSLPDALAEIHPKRGTPWKVIALIAIIELIFVVFWNIRTIAEVTNLGMFIVFISVNASLIWLRYKHPSIVRPFKVPLNIGWFPVLPAIAILVTLAMFAFFSMDVMLMGLGMIAIGTLIYLVLKKKRY